MERTVDTSTLNKVFDLYESTNLKIHYLIEYASNEVNKSRCSCIAM